MKINNKQNVRKTLSWIIVLILLDVLVFLGMIMFDIKKKMLLLIPLLFFLLSIWRILSIRVFNIEITEYILVIKYHHPILNDLHPVLELPMSEIYYCLIENSMNMIFFKVAINKRDKYRTFWYRLDVINQDQLILLQKVVHSLVKRDKQVNAI